MPTSIHQSCLNSIIFSHSTNQSLSPSACEPLSQWLIDSLDSFTNGWVIHWQMVVWFDLLIHLEFIESWLGLEWVGLVNDWRMDSLLDSSLDWLTFWLSDSFLHSSIASLTHSLTHSPTHSLFHRSLTHSFSHPVARSSSHTVCHLFS